MIFNFIKHLIMALLLDAGAALAFDVEADTAAAPATTVVTATPAAQSCALPFAAATDSADAQAANHNDSGTRS